MGFTKWKQSFPSKRVLFRTFLVVLLFFAVPTMNRSVAYADNTPMIDTPNTYWVRLATGAAWSLATTRDGKILLGSTGVWEYKAGEWTELGGMSSPLVRTRISTIVVAPNQQIYVGTADAGVWTYTGGRWERVGDTVNGSEQVTALAVAPNGTLVAGFGGQAGVFRLNGRKWVPMASINSLYQFPIRLAFNALGVLTAVTTKVGMSTDCAVWQMGTDGRWKELAAPTSPVGKYIVQSLTMDSSGSPIAAGYNGLWIYRGGKWSRLGGNQPPFGAVSGVVQTKDGRTIVSAFPSFDKPNAPSGIFELNHGKWTLLGEESRLITNGGNVHLALLPDGSPVVCNSPFVSGGGVWEYSHHTWKLVYGPKSPLMAFSATGLAFDSQGSLYAYTGLGAPAMLFKYSGGQWTNLLHGLPVSGAAMISAFALHGNEVLVSLALERFAVHAPPMPFGVWLLKDGKWIRLGDPTDHNTEPLQVTKLFVESNGTIFAGTRDHGIWEYRTATWIQLGGSGSPVASQDITGIGIYRGKLVAATFAGGLWSFEKGKWSRFSTLPQGTAIVGMSVLSSGIYVHDGQSVWRYRSGKLEKLGDAFPEGVAGDIIEMPDGNPAIGGPSPKEWVGSKWVEVNHDLLDSNVSMAVYHSVIAASGPNGMWLFGPRLGLAALVGETPVLMYGSIQTDRSVEMPNVPFQSIIASNRFIQGLVGRWTCNAASNHCFADMESCGAWVRKS